MKAEFWQGFERVSLILRGECGTLRKMLKYNVLSVKGAVPRGILTHGRISPVMDTWMRFNQLRVKRNLLLTQKSKST